MTHAFSYPSQVPFSGFLGMLDNNDDNSTPAVT